MHENEIFHKKKNSKFFLKKFMWKNTGKCEKKVENFFKDILEKNLKKILVK